MQSWYFRTGSFKFGIVSVPGTVLFLQQLLLLQQFLSLKQFLIFFSFEFKAVSVPRRLSVSITVSIAATGAVA